MESDPGTLSYTCGDELLDQPFVAPYLVKLMAADRPLTESVRMSIAEVSEVAIGRGGEDSFDRVHGEDAACLEVFCFDSWMSRRHARLSLDAGRWRVTDEGSKNGLFVNGRTCREEWLEDGDLLQTGNTVFLFRDRVKRSHREAADLRSSELVRLPKFCQSLYPPLRRSLAELVNVADSSIPILVRGETGTGKELSAKFVHESSRRSGSFVAVNCGALPANLVESELFGHKKGAFSGADRDRVGLIESSAGGTLFLDEIAELPADAQVKLLRVLQEGELTPVGAVNPHRVDLRIVAATHANLEAMVSEGRFREDLYARLAGYVFVLPPLRERKEDLGILLGQRMMSAQAEELRMEREALWALARYDWPQNIRELDHLVELLHSLKKDGPISPSDLPSQFQEIGSPGEPPSRRASDDPLSTQLRALLFEHRGNVSAIAREMGKARVQIRRWCKKFGFDPADYR